MTREETALRFKHWCQVTIGNDCITEDEQMFNNIMALLEQEPCEDCISRKKVLNTIRDWWKTAMMADGKPTLCDSIRDLQSVTPIHRDRTVQDFADKCRECGKQKKGKWITNFHGFTPKPSLVCSECGFDRDFYVRTRGFDKLNYCPYCGAKMGKAEV